MTEVERHPREPETPLQKGMRALFSRMERSPGLGYWQDGYCAYYEVTVGPEAKAADLPLITQVTPDLTGHYPGRRTYRTTLLNGRNSIACRFIKPYDRGRVNGLVTVTRPDIHPDWFTDKHAAEIELPGLCEMVNAAALLSPVETGYEEIELGNLARLLDGAVLIDAQVDPYATVESDSDAD